MMLLRFDDSVIDIDEVVALVGHTVHFRGGREPVRIGDGPARALLAFFPKAPARTPPAPERATPEKETAAK